MIPAGPPLPGPVRAGADLRGLLAVQRATSRPGLVRAAMLVHAAVGRWSFPSSHAASTTTAALVFGRLTGRPTASVLVPVMAVSRMTLGVHTPSDVLAGVAVGAAAAGAHARWTAQGAAT